MEQNSFPTNENKVRIESAVTRRVEAEWERISSKLTDREKKIIELRYGLKDGKKRTLQEVGDEFGVTRERIRQIETKVFRKLNPHSRRRGMKDFCEDNLSKAEKDKIKDQIGRKECETMRKLIKRIAEANQIDYEIEECLSMKKCEGFCPACLEDMNRLKEELLRKAERGETVVIDGIATDLID